MSGVDEPISRPVLRWHGGKWLLAPWIIQHFPAHRVYLEPFGGAASVLLRKPRAYAEIYNDLDAEVVSLFRVLRGPEAARLEHALRLTPFSRVEFQDAYSPTEDPVERARRMIVRSFMGFGTVGVYGRSTGFRADSNRNGTTPAADWRNYPDALPAIVERLRGVVIESRDAVDVMTAFDGVETLHYVDPPYVHSTRGPASGGVKHTYRHEMDDAAHLRLLEMLRDLAGFVVLSGYPHAAYDDALAGWTRIDREARADGARLRTECLWINPRCAEALAAGGGVAMRGLFDGGAA